MAGDPTYVPCPLRFAALRRPDAGAIVRSRGTLSYAELDDRVSAVARRLDEHGVGKGSRVGLYLPKDAYYLILLLALIRTGRVACPLSTRLPAGAVGPLLSRAGVSALISSDEELSGATETTEVLRPETLVLDGGRGEGDRLPIGIPLDRPATVVFTSGSTGPPKAALHTFGNHYFNALGSNENIVLSPGARWLHSLPLYHVGGLSILFRCLLAGAAIALPEPGAKVGGAIAELGATHVSLVSTQLLRLLEEGADLSGLEAVLMGGGPIPPSLVEQAVSRDIPIHTSYGLTEMASQATTTAPGSPREELLTAGRALAYREVTTSEDGEILVRGETLFAGYLEDGKTNLQLDAEGWFHTGDRGQMDDNGLLKVLGRRDNMFVSGGENVQPEEIEAALCRIGGIQEAVVVPVPDEEFGHRPVAFVRRVGRPGDLARKLEKVLPRFKVPKAFYDWEGAGGMKPDRRDLARRGIRRDG